MLAPEPADLSHDQLRAIGRRGGRVEAEVAGDDRVVGRYDDVGFAHERADVEVGFTDFADRLRAVPLPPSTPHELGRVSPALRRGHDPHGRRAVVGEHHGAQRAGEALGQIDNVQSRERSVLGVGHGPPMFFVGRSAQLSSRAPVTG
jgi:hypothetical protein